MTINVVQRSGCNVQMEPSGYYVVRTYFAFEEGGHNETKFDHLTWTETVDVILAELDDHRPGWAIGTGWRQPNLEADFDRPWG